MNVFLALLFVSLARGSLQKSVEKYSTSGEDKPLNDLYSEIAPPLVFNHNPLWTFLSYAMAQRKGGVSLHQDITIELKDKSKTSDIPPPIFPSLEHERWNGEKRSSKIGVRSLSLSSTPAPLPGDVGVCSTQVSAFSTVTHGKLFSNNRRVDLNAPIFPRGVSCRQDRPSENIPGRCVLAGYPHGAWIIVTPEFRQQHSHCHPIPDSPNYTCWDYITVPGYCVLLKDR